MWFRPNKDQLDDAVDQLAGFEAAAIIRLGSMECEAVMPTLSNCLDVFLEELEKGHPIEASLAHQRMMLTVVAASGEDRVMEEYGKQAKVAVAYAAAERLGHAEMKGMGRSARMMLDLLNSGESRECAAEATAMRVHPKERACAA